MVNTSEMRKNAILVIIFVLSILFFLRLVYWTMKSDEKGEDRSRNFELTETGEMSKLCGESIDLSGSDYLRLKYREQIECPSLSFFEEIENDYRPFLDSGGITKEQFDELLSLRFKNHPGQSLLVQYIDNELYLGIANPRHPHATRCLKSFLPIFTYIMRIFPLPNNFEFVMSFLANDQDYDLQYPVLSYCRRNDGTSKHILYPRIYFNERGKWGKYHWERLDSYEKEYPWSSKKNSLIFRGVSTRRERVQLSLLSLQYPDLIDSRITKMITHYADAWPEYYDERINEIETSEYLPMKDQLAWKYIINIDGVGCADRFSNLLIGNSAIFKARSKYEEYWYRNLVEFEDYIPVEMGNDHDVIDKLKFYLQNDEIGEEIARKSTEKIQKILTTDNIFCYLFLVVAKYKDIMNYVPVVRKDMVVHVPKDICHEI